MYKSPGNDHISENLFKQKVKYLYLRTKDSLILFGIRKDLLISIRSLLLYKIYKKGDKTDWNMYRAV
jgi:hypothetical protein